MAVNNALNVNFTANQLLYASSSIAVSGLATANNGVLITSAGGVPSIASTLPNAVQDNITRLGTVTSGVWNGTILTGTYGGTGVNNGASTFTIGGNTSFVGGFTFAGTLTGNTAVTFPTSGTLATTAGTVASVTGTAGRITIGGTATNPTVDIDVTYVGQNTITTLGTITTGTWNGSLIPLAYGGTNANLTASNGGIFYSTGTAGAILAGTATANQVLLSGSTAAPAWSTATYPATTTINRILYSSAANTISEIATANSATLVTSSAGVPSMTASFTNGQVLVGSTGATPVPATISGTGLTVTGGAGTLALSVDAASQSDQETGTSTTTFVTPGRQQSHRSAPKSWVMATVSGGFAIDYNIASIGDGGAGVVTVNFSTSFSSADYVVTSGVECNGGGAMATSLICMIRPPLNAGNFTADTVRLSDAGGSDPDYYHFLCAGDQ